MLYEVITADPSLDRDTIYVTADAAVRAGTSADINQGSADDLTFRITSYNVCYTKLLRE